MKKLSEIRKLQKMHLGPIKRRSVIKKFLNSMRTKAWFEYLKSNTESKTIEELAEALSASPDTFKKYSTGIDTPYFSTIVSIDALIPGSAEVFLLGPHGLPLWVSLSDKVNLSDAELSFLKSIPWPRTTSVANYLGSFDTKTNVPIFRSVDGKTDYLNNLEKYEKLCSNVKNQDYSSAILISSLPQLCRDMDEDMPKLTFWHHLIRTILIYRVIYQSELDSLKLNIRALSWSDHEDTEDNLEEFQIDPESDAAFDPRNDPFHPTDWKYSLFVSMHATRQEIQKDLETLLESDRSEFKSFGLHPQDIISTMMNLHNDQVVWVPFNKRKNLPRWTY